jgi:raffinose/stachyose/melibiose transport system substrate-binding protein
MKKRSAALLTAAFLLTVAGCSGGATGGGTAAAPTDPKTVSGDITVLTHKTDLAADALDRYAAEFNKIYPNVHVKFEAISDYEGQVKIRMNTNQYGDVLMIPGAVPLADYPKFFAPLGTSADLGQKYRFIEGGTYEGQVYGVPINGNANGLVYNKAVWQKAGITKFPTSMDEFRADLQAIKAKTGATPLYTIYHEGWPMGAWQGALGSSTCDPKSNDNLATDPAPWSPGKEMYQIDSLLYNVVHDKLSEADPTTTSWDGAKSQIATEKVGTLMLGSWAISQMMEASRKAGTDPANIGFMPWPVQVNGKFCSVIGADYRQAVSIHSEHKEAARAWLDWFVDKSTYAQDQSLLPTLKNGEMPATLKAYQEAGVEFIELTSEKSAAISKIDNESEIGLGAPDYRQRIVDLARGTAKGTLDAEFAKLNQKWAAAITTAGS